MIKGTSDSIVPINVWYVYAPVHNNSKSEDYSRMLYHSSLPGDALRLE